MDEKIEEKPKRSFVNVDIPMRPNEKRLLQMFLKDEGISAAKLLKGYVDKWLMDKILEKKKEMGGLQVDNDDVDFTKAFDSLF